MLNLKNLVQLAIWPVAALLLVIVLWTETNLTLDDDWRMASTHATTNATALAKSYAAQLLRTLEQIDQLTLDLKDEAEDPSAHLNLERKHSRGMFPEESLLYATILNSKGEIVTTTFSSEVRPDESDLDFFLQHKNSCCLGLLITTAETGRREGHPVIRFSRRINHPDGSFNGAAVVAVEPGFLVSFQDEEFSGVADFVSARLTSGPLLASKLGGTSPRAQVYYRQSPAFPSISGAKLESGEKFVDMKPRFVAWKKLQKYPVVAIAAISEDEVLARYRTVVKNRESIAAGGSIVIVLFAFIGMALSHRLAVRRQREAEARATYRLATDAANEGFYLIRPDFSRQGEIVDFRIEDCNDRAAELFGMTREALMGSRASQILTNEKYRREVCKLCQQVLDVGFYEDELRVPPASILSATWVYRRMVRSGGALALTIRDISQVKEHEQALSRLANNDALTQLPNRHWLATFLPDAIARASSHHGHLAVLFIDLDNFKNINDELGHDAGDELLIQAARRLKSVVRASDQVVRLGGDEFLVILEQVDIVDDISRVARAVIRVLGEPFTLSGGAGNQVSASIGISIFPQDGSDSETLLKHADVAMYAAKAAGKGRYYFYQSHLSDNLLLRLSKERALQQAVERDEFIIHYQPRVDVRTGVMSSMEALIRWAHPDRGIVYPAEFIDLAEDMGLIVQIGELVIEKVCLQLARWKTEGLSQYPISINISPHQLKHGTVAAFLSKNLHEMGIDPSLVEIELTESAVIDKSQAVSRELTELRAIGVTLMIDDFGTGYSSLAQLHRIDVDVLKVDQAFTKSLCEGEEGKLLFRAIVSMADALDMKVVAEGVETSEQLDILQSLSCDEVQGFLVSKAVTAGEAAELMLKRILLPRRAPPFETFVSA